MGGWVYACCPCQIGLLVAAGACLLLSAARSPAVLLVGFLSIRIMCLGAVVPWSTVPLSQWSDSPPPHTHTHTPPS